MTEEYIPDTEEVRAWYVRGVVDAKYRYGFEDWEKQVYVERFDRWYLQEIEKAEYSGYLRAVQDVDNTRRRFGTGNE